MRHFHSDFEITQISSSSLITALYNDAKEAFIQRMAIDSFIAKYNITAREAEIVRHIYQGMTNKEIADKLFVTVQTIKDHTHRIYQKTDVKSRAQLTSLLRTFF